MRIEGQRRSENILPLIYFKAAQKLSRVGIEDGTDGLFLGVVDGMTS